jgi:hypothetical protein
MNINTIALICLIGVGLLVIGIGQAILKHLWANFKWHILGWKPKILDAKTVDATVAECSGSFASSLEKHMNEELGIVITGDPNGMRASVESYTRSVIERYIENFVRR